MGCRVRWFFSPPVHFVLSSGAGGEIDQVFKGHHPICVHLLAMLREMQFYRAKDQYEPLSCKAGVSSELRETVVFDVEAIECLEQALSDCPCGMLLVSHDQCFLDTLAHKRWHISKDRQMQKNYILEMK